MKLNSYINNCFISPRQSIHSLYNISQDNSKACQNQIREISDSESEQYTYEERIEKIQKKLKNKKLSESQIQDYKFQILKLKCQIGNIGINNKSKHCTLIKKELMQIMGEYSPNFCFLVFTGMHNDLCINIIKYPANKKNYFEIKFRDYNVIVYEIKKESTKIQNNNLYQQYNNNSLITNNSICSIEFDNTMMENESIDNLQSKNNSHRSFKAPTFQRVQTRKSKTCSLPNIYENPIQRFKSARTFKTAASQILSPQNSIMLPNQNKSNYMNNSQQFRNGNFYLQQQIMKDEKKFQQSVQKFYKNASTIVHPTYPSREKVFNMGKTYKQYLSKLKTVKNTNCKDYAIALKKAFNNFGYEPKLIIVKREPQGDYFWDYECENDVAIHTWDLIRNYGVSICL